VDKQLLLTTALAVLNYEHMLINTFRLPSWCKEIKQASSAAVQQCSNVAMQQGPSCYTSL